LLAGLLSRDVRGVFLDGGPTLAGSFVAAGLVDRVISYIAPALLGAGRPGLIDAGIITMDDILRLETLAVDRSGPDVRIIARPRR
jgi:diaminohydroxyphosphoribosylaminopyrimidine deaminase/5-amino-6-(5-phosphoribosylamino)uracil reductase